VTVVHDGIKGVGVTPSITPFPEAPLHHPVRAIWGQSCACPPLSLVSSWG
jgi:hypothetical protein